MNARTIFGIVLLALGIGALTGLHVLNLLFAAALVYFGVRLVTGTSSRTGDIFRDDGADTINEFALCSPFNRRITSQNLRGGRIVLLFAGGDIDFSHAKSADASVALELIVIFGGARIVVPPEWTVRQRGVAILGGYADKTVAPSTSSATLRLDGAVMCGGIEISR